MALYLHSEGYDNYLTNPLDGRASCQDCDMKLDEGYGPEETLCGACYNIRLEEPCHDCMAIAGEECDHYCVSRLV